MKDRAWFAPKGHNFYQSSVSVQVELFVHRYQFHVGLSVSQWKWGIETRGMSVAFYLGPLQGFVNWFDK